MTRDLNDLYYFAQVVDHGGFAPAGRALGIPKSRLSRRIAQLEQRLHARLIHRSTRQFHVTELGQTFYQHCKAVLVEAEAAEQAIAATHTEPRGVVRMTCPLALLDTRVGAMVARFMQAHPLVDIHLEGTNRRVDVLAERVDVAIRVRPPPLADSDLVLRTLATRRQCLVASPSLLAAAGMPDSPAALSELPSLSLGDPHEDHAWHLHGPDHAQATIRHQPRLVSNDMPALRAAAQAGVGVVQLPNMMMADAMRDGSLVQVLPGWAPRHELIHAVFPSRRGLLPAVRHLLDHLTAQFADLDEE